MRGASCNCKAYISLSYKTAIQKLYVTSTNPKHNHPLPIKNPKVIVIQEPPKSPSPLEDHHSEIEDSTMIKSDSNVNRDPGNFKMKAGDELPYPQNSKMLKSNSSIPTPSHTNQINYYPAHSAPHNKYSNHPNLYTPSPQTQTSHLHSSTHNNQNIFQNINLGSGSMNNFGPLNKLPNANNSSANGTNLTKLNPSNSTGANHSTPSKYSQLLAVIEDMGRDIRPAYSGSKVAAERLKRGIVHSRILVRECLLEAEKCART
ncbi:AAC-rich mRNA clone AAC11 protein-like isoform X2 [Gordionus sp. m RMFG-2023]|uniref:AAC-rich mRNA clone AAC11 protein-like isoform X2 n=1 Tax=Gordionus sp. m RMFG-2023 TaxID=3053472 RepID=UPI0031FD448D